MEKKIGNYDIKLQDDMINIFKDGLLIKSIDVINKVEPEGEFNKIVSRFTEMYKKYEK